MLKTTNYKPFFLVLISFVILFSVYCGIAIVSYLPQNIYGQFIISMLPIGFILYLIYIPDSIMLFGLKSKILRYFILLIISFFLLKEYNSLISDYFLYKNVESNSNMAEIVLTMSYYLSTSLHFIWGMIFTLIIYKTIRLSGYFLAKDNKKTN
jgi:hypothetical protein